MRSKNDTETRSWVTRERPKVDRIACPWLIRRFIDPEAEFLFAPTEPVFAVAAETGATAYDIPGAEPFSHDGELCSFDAFLKVYGIEESSPRYARADRARSRYRASWTDSAIARSARSFARALGQFPGRPCNACAWHGHVRRPLRLVPLLAGRDPQLDAGGLTRGEPDHGCRIRNHPDRAAAAPLDPRDRRLLSAAGYFGLRRARGALWADGERARHREGLARKRRCATRSRSPSRSPAR